MYLSRLILNPRSSAVRRDLADCQAMHRTIMSAFQQVAPQSSPRADLGVLYRVDTNPHTGAIAVIVQSEDEPNWGSLPDGYLMVTDGGPRNPACQAVDAVYNRLSAGTPLRFRLRANPTKKIDTKTGIDGRRRNGARAELHGDEALLAWLQRKGETAGFELAGVDPNRDVPDVRIVSEGKLAGDRPTLHHQSTGEPRDRLTFRTVLFEGRLRVTDAELFRRALAQGIGPGKAYGCGLLSIARPRGEP